MMTDSEIRRLAEILIADKTILDEVVAELRTNQLADALRRAVAQLIAERSAEVVKPGTEEKS